MNVSNSSGALVSAEWLQDRLEDPKIVLVEISGMGAVDVAAYGNGHIPGALNWHWQQMLWDPITRDFPTAALFASRMESQGISNDTTVLFYGEDVQFGTYAWWVLRYCGHDDVKVLDGGRRAWVANGFPLEISKTQPTPRQGYSPRSRREEMRVMRDAVLNHLNAGGLILDARSPEEYSGERLMPYGYDDHGAVRYGRIPGARHMYYRDLVDEQNRFKPVNELQTLLKDAIDGDSEVVAYCRTSHRASFVYFTLHEILGVDRVRLYDGSWTEWGNLVGYPIELARA